MNTPDIKIVPGIRRSGKSKLLSAFADYIRQIDSTANIIEIDLTKLRFEKLKEYLALNEYVEKQYKEGVNNYLMIDEVQLCGGFELTINSLHSEEKYDIYLTGSNAFLLSSDLATLIQIKFVDKCGNPAVLSLESVKGKTKWNQFNLHDYRLFARMLSEYELTKME